MRSVGALRLFGYRPPGGVRCGPLMLGSALPCWRVPEASLRWTAANQRVTHRPISFATLPKLDVAGSSPGARSSVQADFARQSWLHNNLGCVEGEAGRQGACFRSPVKLGNSPRVTGVGDEGIPEFFAKAGRHGMPCRRGRGLTEARSAAGHNHRCGQRAQRARPLPKQEPRQPATRCQAARREKRASPLGDGSG